MKPSRIYLILIFSLIITSISWIISCTHKADISNLPEVCFEGDVLPIFRNSCAISGCHDGSGESHMSFDSFENILRSVVPGDPYSSKAYRAIIATWGENKMPPDRPLSVENRITIRLWIEQGAQLTVCPEATGNGGGGEPYFNPRACFGRDILPVLVSRCATTGCHDAITHKEGHNFTSYTSTLSTVVPGNPGGSKLYQVIRLSSGEEKMPPADKPQLTLAEIDSIGKWISYGALNENCGEVCDTINPVTFSGTIWPVIRTSCTGCHSGASPSGAISLESYSNVATVASSGVLMNALKGSGVPRMPPSGYFSACRIRQFEMWINSGFPNN